ncbi:YbaK/EbsC family protein [Thiohalobacter sp. IOR34]|uniref:aminoacyl-tRNA deacylase n=1 Tax=Thiohalobacter sp. IOR34 TaxID=3057176 RepID=UPI0025B23DFD|nr:YbaK/EbsC family protein [Thiohalobacter sp. IOR34]WJW76402.1 YbaK/EbsC family protein [Thiohalobacter sp. IOR34]
MSPAPRVQQYLAHQQVAYELVPHPHTASSQETALAAHVPEDHLAKGVLVKDADGYALVVIPASHWLQLDRLNSDSGRDFQLASEAEVAALFPDCEVGAVPPLGPAYGVETFLDEALTTLARIWFEAGDHHNLIRVDGADFLDLLRGVRHGHYSYGD